MRRDLKTVHVFNLPFTCMQEDLYKLAIDFGEIEELELPTKKGLN
jgi:hypothetical protein